MDVTHTLYEWYLQKWERDEELAKPGRVALQYDGTDLISEPIDKFEFTRWLGFKSDNPRAKQMWINGFVHGHESEVQSLPHNVQQFLRDSVNNLPTFLVESDVAFRDAS